MPNPKPTKPKLLVIVGPTASGKTALASRLARMFDGEIVSADSRQIYRGMNVGTAKAPKNELKEIKHYLVDIKNPDEDYTVAEYKKDAIKAIQKIVRKNKLPILAGGTGLYVKAVVDNLDIPAVKPNPFLRKKLEMRIEREGLEKLYKELVERDPEAAYIVDGKNPRRVIRALEVIIATGKPFSAQRKRGERIFDMLEIGILRTPAELKKIINRRADGMIKNGLANEVKELIKKYGSKPAAFDAIGYREIIALLNTGERADQRGLNAEPRRKILRQSASSQRKSASLEEAVIDIKKNTLAFAKRQMTWFRKDKEIKWVRNEREAITLVRKFLS